jgi:hypothetical protein
MFITTETKQQDLIGKNFNISKPKKTNHSANPHRYAIDTRFQWPESVVLGCT